MADDEQAGAPPDVDAMDDAAFSELKTEMRKEVDRPERPAEDKPAKAAPEAKKADAPETGGDDDDTKAETVPHGQFHRERERRKQAEEREKLLSDNYTKLLARTQELLEPRQQQEQQTETVPDFDSDPFAAGKWTNEQLRKIQQEMKERSEREQQTATERQQDQVFQTHVKAAIGDFIKTAPDYPAAFNHLAQARDAELKALYPQLTDEQRVTYLKQEYRAIFDANLRAGVNPAQKIYEIAKGRGYQPKGATPPPNAAADLTRQEELRVASLSLGKGGGAVADTGRVSPEQLLEMSDADFAAYKKKHGSVAHAFRT